MLRFLCAIALLVLGNLLLAADVAAINEQVRPSVVQITLYDGDENKLGTGSGFVIDKGIVATCYHVINNSVSASVKTSDKVIYPVDGVLAFDKDKDIAILSVKKLTDLTPLKFANDDEIKIGSQVIAIGAPLGLEGTVTEGIVSAKRSMPKFGDVIQVSCPVSPGNSGCPLVDANGDVVAMTSFSMVNGQNLNFGIPSNAISALAQQQNEAKSIDELPKENNLITEYGVLPPETVKATYKVPKAAPFSLAPFIGIRYIPGSVEVTTVVERRDEKKKKYKQTVPFELVSDQTQLGQYKYYMTKSGALIFDQSDKKCEITVSYQYQPLKVAIAVAKDESRGQALKILSKKLIAQKYQLITGAEVDASASINLQSRDKIREIAQELNAAKLYIINAKESYSQYGQYQYSYQGQVNLVEIDLNTAEVVRNETKSSQGVVGVLAAIILGGPEYVALSDCFDSLF